VIKYKSNMNQFFKILNQDIDDAMESIGKPGVDSIKRETPVITGKLKEGTYYTRESYDSTTFRNDVDYSPFVQLGTYKQGSNPFFTRGIMNSIATFTKIIIQKLKK
jgi:tagatose-1,6-bisphosphate aldolase